LSLPTYYRYLRDSGYVVAGVGKFDLHKPDFDWGLDGSKMVKEYGFTRGIDNEGKWDAISSYRKQGNRPAGPYMDFLRNRGLDLKHADTMETGSEKHNGAWVTGLPDDAYCDNWVAANAVRFLREFPDNQPWHLVVNFTGPHDPFDVTANMHDAWKDADLPAPYDNDAGDPNMALARRQHYAAMIENIDQHVGRMIELVKQRGELDNTIIVYASDHGEMLGDHGRWGKSVWYTPSAGVPLIASGPGMQSGTSSDALVSLHDLAATFLDYAQADPLPDSDSVSLRRVLEGQNEKHRDYVTSGLNDWNTIFDGRYKCVTGFSKSPMLFDTHEDPHELMDIAATHPRMVAQLVKKLESETRKPEPSNCTLFGARRAVSSRVSCPVLLEE